MASFVTQVCDRCGAHFPLDPKHPSVRPVQKITVSYASGIKSEKEMCGPCRDKFYEVIGNFFRGEK